MNNRSHTQETKNKMREARLSRKKRLGYINSLETRKRISEAGKGKPAWNKGKKMSGEAKLKMSISAKNRPTISEKTRKKLRERFMGEKSHWWKGGKMLRYPELDKIRKSKEYRLWHKVNLERDYFTCQKCKKHGGELRVHHINNFLDFPELRLAIDNGITLCQVCHKQFHKKYGLRNNTREQLTEFIVKK